MPNYYPYSVTFSGVASVSDENGTCAGGPQYNHFVFDLSECNTLHGLATTTTPSPWDSASVSPSVDMGEWKVWNECSSTYDQTYQISQSRAKVGYTTNFSTWGVQFGDPNVGNSFFFKDGFSVDESSGDETITVTVNNANSSDDATMYFGWGGTATIEFRKKPPVTFTAGYRRMSLAPVRISTVNPPWLATTNGTLNSTNQITRTPVNNQRITFVPGYRRMSLAPARRAVIIPPYLQEPRPLVYPGNFTATTSTPQFPTVDPTYTSTTTNGQLTSVDPTNNGGNYPTTQEPPVIAIEPPKQTATLYGNCGISGGVITSLVVGNSGAGYTQAPTVTISGGGGSGATATANVNNGRVTSITVTSGGSGYTSCPTVTFSPPGGNATPEASCTISSGAITAIPVGDGGVGYTQAPSITLTGGGGSGATATATIDSNGTVTSINITNGGSGYTSCPSVQFTFPTETATAGACTITNGAITDIPLDFVGNGYTEAPIVTLSGGGGSGATAVATIHSSGFVTGITITNGGSGYTSCPTIILSSPSSQPPATPSSACTISAGVITAIPIGNVGNGYVTAPSVTLTGGGGSGATATTSINSNGEVTSINITNGGTGYTSCPTVVISSPQIPPVITNPPIETGHISGRPEVQNPGEGYVDPPVVIITPPTNPGNPEEPETNLPPVPPPIGPPAPPPVLPRPTNPSPEGPNAPWAPWPHWCKQPPCIEGYVEVPNVPDPSSPPDPGRREGGYINGSISNYLPRHSLRNYIYNPHGVSQFGDKERKFELRGIGRGGTSELYGAIKIHRGLFFPFSPHQLFFTTFKYRSVDSNESDALNAANIRIEKDLGTHNGISWEVVEYNDCFKNPTEAELRDFLRKFNVIDNDISTTNYSFIRLVGMVQYNGNMLDSSGKQYCLVYCNKSVPSSVTQIQSLANGYLVLTSSDRIQCKYITMRKIKYAGQ